MPISSAKYPSNWELSSARACTIVRYLISRFKFNPALFTAVGYADTRPANNNQKTQISKNRRVEIIVLKSKYNALEKVQNPVLKMNKDEQAEFQARRKELISQLKSQHDISPAAQALMKNKKYDKNAIIDMKNYAESKGLSLDNKELYNTIQPPKFKTTNTSLEEQLPKNEDFEL